MYSTSTNQARIFNNNHDDVLCIPPQIHQNDPHFHQLSQLSQSTVQSRLGFGYDATSNPRGFYYGYGNGNI